jgi:ATP-dependent DNA ligase
VRRKRTRKAEQRLLGRIEMSIAKANLLGTDVLRVLTPHKSGLVPTGTEWLHEVKYDVYRMMIIREQDRVRLISSGGHDWAQHFPLIVEAALKLRQEHFVIDGEAVLLDPGGVSDFVALHSGKRNELAQLYAFDMLASDGEDHRWLPLGRSIEPKLTWLCASCATQRRKWKRLRLLDRDFGTRRSTQQSFEVEGG